MGSTMKNADLDMEQASYL